MKRLKRSAVERVWKKISRSLGDVFLAETERQCLEAGDADFPDEPPSLHVKQLLADAIHQIDYASWAGRDGNWEEFAGTWLTDENAEELAKAMSACGWVSEMDTFE